MTTARGVVPQWAEYLIVTLAGLFTLGLIVWFFEQWPIEKTTLALDWISLYAGVKDGVLRYTEGVRSPPWSVIVLLPLGFLSFRASWGLISLYTLLVTVLSVPLTRPRWKTWLAIFLLITSFPSLRHLVDGNLEGLVIGGALLLLAGLERRQPLLTAAGLLLVTVKPQEVWMWMIVLAVELWRTWSRRAFWQMGGLVAFMVVVTLAWKGLEWWPSMADSPYRGTIIDISLLAASDRLGWPVWVKALAAALLGGVTLGIALRAAPAPFREKATFLVAASMLLSPYTAGNSFLTIVGLGVIPLFLARPPLGLALLVLTNLPYFADKNWLFNCQSYYWTVLLLIVWAGWGGRLWRNAQFPISNRQSPT
jgi:hypothetical protein